MADGDGIKADGFLSPELEKYRTGYLQRYFAAFQPCFEQSGQATQLLFSAEITEVLNHQLLAIALWQRSVRSCQAAIMLCERGMVPEARIQIRSAYEFLFYSVAALFSPDAMDDMIRDELIERRKMAEGLRKTAPDGHLNIADLSFLDEIIKDANGPGKSKLSAFDAAQLAGMEYLYQTVYRGMSLDASHATIYSTNHFFQTDEEGNLAPVFGPSDIGIEFTLSLISTCLANGLAVFSPFIHAQNSLARQ